MIYFSYLRSVLSLSAVLSLSLFSSGQNVSDPKTPGNAAVRPETDDATKRRDFQRQWYEKPITPEFMKFMNKAAARERAKNGKLLPQVLQGGTSTSPTIAISNTVIGSVWANLGPARANYLQNGSFTLSKTDSGRVVEVVPHPTNNDVLYVAMSGGGVWKTVNATASTPTWVPLTEALGSLSTGALALDPANPDVLYLGLGDSFDGTGIGFSKSIDGGSNWSDPVYLGTSTRITEIKVAEAPNNNIVLVATDTGLFRSIDSGASFSAVNVGGLTSPYAWSIAWGGGANYALTLEAAPLATSGTTDGQIWYSSDNGASWTRSTGVAASSGIGRVTVASSPLSRNVMYAEAAIPLATSSADLADFFRSTDGGHTWTGMGASARRVAYTSRNRESSNPRTLLNGQGWYNQLVLPSRSDVNTVFFGGALLLARVDNALSTSPLYTQVTNWLGQFELPYVHADYHAAAYGQDGTFYVGTDGGIFASQDGGLTWTDKYNVGIVSHLVYSIGSTEASGAENAVIGGFQDDGTRVREGATAVFNQELGGDGFGSHIHPLDGNLMIGTLYNTRIYKSTDGGVTFAAASTGIRESNTSSAPFNTRIVPWLGDATGNTLYTHVNLKVYKSADYAGKWTALGTNGLLTSGAIRNIGVAKTDSNIVGAVASGGRVFLTNDGGATWSQTTAPPNNDLSMSSVWFDTVDPQIVYVASVAPNGAAAHLWKSTDFGTSWSFIDGYGTAGNGLPPGVPVNTIVNDPADHNTLYAGTHLGVYKSTDAGSSWTRFGSGLPLVNVTDFYISPSSKMRAATYGRGFWQLNP